jgi:cation diffusion facilitator family transporter
MTGQAALFRGSLLSISPPRDEAAVAVRESVYVDASRAAEWGLGVNVVLMIVKLAGGIFTASSALIADAVNSIGDVASALAVRGALHVAQIEEDEDHPYGHSKAESIAGLCVALLVAFSAGLLALETMKRFADELKVPSIAAGVIALVCGIAKEIIYRYTKRVATRLDSAALRATAWDHRADALSSGVVAVSLLVAPYAGWLGPYIDPVAALCVCVLLVITGLRIFTKTARELMDQQADEATVDHIRELSQQVTGVEEVEKLRVRKSGLEYFIEIHLEVDGNLSVNEGHRIGHEVKDRLLNELPRVRDVHVHVEPHDRVAHSQHLARD